MTREEIYDDFEKELKFEVGKIIKLKNSKIEWKIVSIENKICSFSGDEYKSFTLANIKNNNDGRNYKSFRENDLLEKIK